jgi:D-glycero-D-manno-heptose 1,7-bisphosphate phosphatase
MAAHQPHEWTLMPGVRELLGGVSWDDPSGPRLGIASNQDQVAYGYLSHTMARDLLRDLAHSAANFVPEDPALQLCPHPLDWPCGCRKPAPGMLLAIMEFYGIEPSDTVFVGNHEVDREAAARAEIAFRWAGDFFGQRQ